MTATKMTVKVAYRTFKKLYDEGLSHSEIFSELRKRGASNAVVARIDEILEYEFEQEAIRLAENARGAYDETGMPIRW